MEVRPASSTAFVATQRVDTEITSTAVWNLVMPTPVVHETVVLDAESQSVDADLVFRPQAGLRDRPIDVSHRVRSERPSLIRLPPGTYDVRITPLQPTALADPSSADLPPVEVTDFVVQPGDDFRRKEFMLPRRYRSLSGAVRNRVMRAERLAGVEVSAVGVETGMASTLSVTTSNGVYQLFLPDSRDTSYRLTAVLPAAFQPAWRFEQVVQVGSTEDRRKDIDLDLPSDAVRGSVALEVIGLDDRGPESVGDARVTLTANRASPLDPRIFSVTGITDGAGRVLRDTQLPLPVLRGTYQATVEPPRNSAFARLENLLDLGAVGERVTTNVRLELQPRTVLRGRVLDAENRAAAFSRLEFQPIGGPGAFPETATDVDGRFSVALDPGSYLMAVEPLNPDEGPPQPRSAAVIDVPADRSEVNLPDFQLPRGVPVEGVLQSEEGEPIPRAEISVFNRPTQDPSGSVRYLVARAESDEDGRFLVVLAE